MSNKHISHTSLVPFCHVNLWAKVLDLGQRLFSLNSLLPPAAELCREKVRNIGRNTKELALDFL